MTQKVIKTGNSLAVTIPAEFVRMVGIRPGDEARSVLKPEKGLATFSFSGAKQLPLSENFVKLKKPKKE